MDTPNIPVMTITTADAIRISRGERMANRAIRCSTAAVLSPFSSFETHPSVVVTRAAGQSQQGAVTRR